MSPEGPKTSPRKAVRARDEKPDRRPGFYFAVRSVPKLRSQKMLEMMVKDWPQL
jgi:hypothetical protein